MYEDVLSYLMCPVCRSELVLDGAETVGDEVVAGKLECDSGHGFAIREGVVDFGARRQSRSRTKSEADGVFGRDNWCVGTGHFAGRTTV